MNIRAGIIGAKIGLIPRYNWDYGFYEFAKALLATASSMPNRHQTLERVFGQKPIFTSSGRTSLYVILKSLGLPKGSFVGVPLFCCHVVFDAIIQAGLTPEFLDIDLDDFNLSASYLEKKKDSLSAIIVVHMFGHPADMDSIDSVAGNIPVIEDCAQSLFSEYMGDRTGFLSTASFFSFRSGKYISAGEGSAIFCRDSSLRVSMERVIETFEDPSPLEEISHCAATYIKSLLYKRPWYGTIGYPIGSFLDRKFNLTAKSGFRFKKIMKSDLRIVNDRMETFLTNVKKQRENALYLLQEVKIEKAYLPYERKGCLSNYYQFAVRFESKEQRDLMRDYLWSHGIDSARYLDEVVNVAKTLYGYQGDCPNAELCSKAVLVIPHHYNLSLHSVAHIANTLNDGNEYLKNHISH
ncbi:MAG: DegT/DnrJ/EryC1/StrS family aminotransferase [Candidatus Hodarchaeota archaeon]